MFCVFIVIDFSGSIFFIDSVPAHVAPEIVVNRSDPVISINSFFVIPAPISVLVLVLFTIIRRFQYLMVKKIKEGICNILYASNLVFHR